MKTVLLIPGFREDLKTRDYQQLIAGIKSKGYNVLFVPIHWQRTTFDDWVIEFRNIYKQYNPTDTILAGFSYGSMIALAAAAERTPFALWLFSLSPYFAEDLPYMKKSWLGNIGHRRVTAFSNLHFNRLAPKITCSVLLFAGELEVKKWPIIGKRSQAAQERLKQSKLTIVPGVEHDATAPVYIQAVLENI